MTSTGGGSSRIIGKYTGGGSNSIWRVTSSKYYGPGQYNKNYYSWTEVYYYNVISSYLIESSISKGTTRYEDVTAQNDTAYPNDSYSGNHWYVYKGIQ